MAGDVTLLIDVDSPLPNPNPPPLPPDAEPYPPLPPPPPDVRLALEPLEKLESNMWERSGVERLNPLDFVDDMRTFIAGDKVVGVGIPAGAVLPGVMKVVLSTLPGVALAGVDIPRGEEDP